MAKSDLLLDPDSTSTDPAVKAAMAETTILTETEIYLTDHGVNLSSLTTSQKTRSDKVIIAKNFPYGTTHDELVLLFGGTDIVKRILLPPAGTIAFIEFYDSGQVRAAFKRLAYRRFKDTPSTSKKPPKESSKSNQQQNFLALKQRRGQMMFLQQNQEDPGINIVC